MAYFDFNTPINENITLIARYKIKTFKITIQQDAYSHVTVTCDGVDYTSDFTTEWGKTVTIKSVTYDYPYKKNTLTLNGTAVDVGHTFTVDKAFTLLSNSRLLQYTITVTQPANGSISINGVVGTTFTFNHGDYVEVQATANSGYYVNSLDVSDA